MEGWRRDTQPELKVEIIAVSILWATTCWSMRSRGSRSGCSRSVAVAAHQYSNPQLQLHGRRRRALIVTITIKQQLLAAAGAMEMALMWWRIVEVGNRRHHHHRRRWRRSRRRWAAVPEPCPVPPVDIHVSPECLRGPELPLAEAAGVGSRWPSEEAAAAVAPWRRCCRRLLLLLSAAAWCALLQLLLAALLPLIHAS